LASIYKHVYLDFGLAIPSLSVKGMIQSVEMLLELAPTSKIMYSSDAHMIPELFYFGSKWARYAVNNVLQDCIQNGEIDLEEAKQIALSIFRTNAIQLYNL